jgi:hypothetical protein
VVVRDLQLPEEVGLERLAAAAVPDAGVPVILMTAIGARCSPSRHFSAGVKLHSQAATGL